MRSTNLLGMTVLLLCCAACEPQGSTETAGSAAGSATEAATIQGPGGVAIPESLFRLYSLNRLQKPMEQLSDEERSTLLTQLSELKLLANAAEARGLDDERTIATELELQRIQAMARFMALRYLEEHPATEYELRTVYEANLARLAGTQYKARHILLRTEDEAQDVIQALNAGSDFAELARQRSTGPTGPNGGDLGWFSAESMVRPFAEAVATMSPGNYSASPVQTRFGWHVILLEDRREQQEPGLDAVRAEITNLVNQQKIESYVQELSHSQQ